MQDPIDIRLYLPRNFVNEVQALLNGRGRRQDKGGEGPVEFLAEADHVELVVRMDLRQVGADGFPGPLEFLLGDTE